MRGKGWRNILRFIMPYIFIVGLFQFVGIKLSEIHFIKDYIYATAIQEIFIASLTLLGTFLSVFLFTKWVDKEENSAIGFHSHSKLKWIGLGVAIGFLLIVIAFVFLIIFQQIEFVRFDFSGLEILFSVILFLIIAVTEEIVYRGYLLRNLMKSVNKYLALVISAIVFALMHSWNPHMDVIASINIFLAGILLGLPYIFTRNLWFPIALHFSWNFFQSLFGFPVSGQDSFSVIKINLPEKNIINGGAFGFEGSILSIFLLFAVIIGIFYYFHKGEKYGMESISR